MIIFVDLSIIAIVVFFCMALGLQGVATLMGIILKFQYLILGIFVVIAFIFNIGMIEKSSKNPMVQTISYLIYSCTDSVNSIGLLIVVMTQLQAFIKNVSEHFIGMILIGVLALLEIAIISGCALAGSLGIFFIRQDVLDMAPKNKRVGAHICMAIFSICWTIVFLVACKVCVINRYHISYANIFNNTIFDKIIQLIPW